MADGRGLPLLSGPPPPPNDSSRADIACRKCNKEFNIIFTRARRCNHCGYSYCSSCTDFQALMPRTGAEAGYAPMPVCAFCIEYLTITAAGRNHLKSLSLAKLKNYVAAYNIRIDRAVEKDDLIDGIIAARGENGCLKPANEDFYRKYSVPDRAGGTRRSIFSRAAPADARARAPQPPRAPPAHEFARPDLEPDTPARSHRPPRYAPPAGAPPAPAPRPQQTPPRAAPPPHPQYAPRPQHPAGPYRHGSAAHSSHNLNAPPAAAPRPRAASVAPAPRPPPTPPPTLDELLGMPAEAIAALSVHALKTILYANHVTAALVLEKGELVGKVGALLEEERRVRERQRAAEAAEEAEIVRRQHAMMEEHARVQREREEARRRAEEAAAAAAAAAMDAAADPPAAEGGGAPVPAGTAPPESSVDGASPSPPPPLAAVPPAPLPPKAQAMAASLERTGLCVICQDEEANIAIVDCGHLAMCRSCSELVMASSRECPLCRTRIVTEARLLRIFKT